jgi:hypothetical protein
MKAMILSDEINLFHWNMLKSVLLVLSLLPSSQGMLHLWQVTEGSSQIMVGFFAISLLSSLLVLSFYSALKASHLNVQADEPSMMEQWVVRLYRHLPMLSLATMLSYLVTQI